MEQAPQIEITQLLKAWTDGDSEALNRLAPIVYNELRRIARGYVRRESTENSMQPTALVHEVYLKLLNTETVEWQDRAHFFAIAARQMRRVLVDSARSKTADKRGGGAMLVELNESLDGAALDSEQMVKLDDALDALDAFDARKARVVELRFFAGLGVDETAAVLNISTQSVMRDWRLARVWLARELEG